MAGCSACLTHVVLHRRCVMLCRPGEYPTETTCTFLHKVCSLTCRRICRGEATTHLAGFCEEAVQVLEHGRAILSIDACHHLIFVVVEVPFSFQLCIRRAWQSGLGELQGGLGGKQAWRELPPQEPGSPA